MNITSLVADSLAIPPTTIISELLNSPILSYLAEMVILKIDFYFFVNRESETFSPFARINLC